MQKGIDILEFARKQILEPTIHKSLPILYKYAVCNHLNKSDHIAIPYSISLEYNTNRYCVMEIYKPIVNNGLNLNEDERGCI